MPTAGGEQQFVAVIDSMQHPTVVAWSMVLSSILGLLTPALIICFQTLLYFDLRFRKEGFDLDLLLERGTPARSARPTQEHPAAQIGI
jgi:hypothetical protein